jgi:hypothetical protein
LSQEIDYKKELLTVLEQVGDIGLQLQFYAKNNKDRINQSLAQNPTKDVEQPKEDKPKQYNRSTG